MRLWISSPPPVMIVAPPMVPMMTPSFGAPLVSSGTCCSQIMLGDDPKDVDAYAAVKAMSVIAAKIIDGPDPFPGMVTRAALHRVETSTPRLPVPEA